MVRWRAEVTKQFYFNYITGLAAVCHQQIITEATNDLKFWLGMRTTNVQEARHKELCTKLEKTSSPAVVT